MIEVGRAEGKAGEWHEGQLKGKGTKLTPGKLNFERNESLARPVSQISAIRTIPS